MKKWENKILFAIFTTVLIITAISTNAAESAKRILLENGIEEIIFAEREFGRGSHWYENFGYKSFGKKDRVYGKKGRLCKLNVINNTITVLLEDLEGTIRDPQVHYNGEKILFSYRKGGEIPFHLYEINVDGRNLTQLTDGIYDDIEPTYLPDGGIMFVSGRSRKWVPCWSTQVATLYSCDGNGNNISSISANVEQDNTPRVLPDGRILYTRWEYVDRSQIKFHHLWTCNPDGTNQDVFYGNMNPGGVFIDAKPIRGTNKIIFINSPNHGMKEHAGSLATVTSKYGSDDKSAIKAIKSLNKKNKIYYRDPYPITKDIFLVANEKKLQIILSDGKTFSLYESSEMINEPSPLIKRKREKLIPNLTNVEKETGTVILNNVYIGRNMKGIKNIGNQCGIIQMAMVLNYTKILN